MSGKGKTKKDLLRNEFEQRMAEIACNQRKLYLSYMGVNGIRYTPISPYPQYTPAQLNMRRKAQILQNPVNTVNLTKAQIWTNINKNGVFPYCSDNQLLYIPTTASDVPGPVIDLYNDTNIPLYNYLPELTTANFPMVPYPYLKQSYNIYPTNNAVIKQNTYGQIANLIIINPTSSKYSFTVQIPIAISISAYSNLASLYETPVTTIQLNISKISLEVFYSELLISTIPIIYLNDISKILQISVDGHTGQFSASSYIGDVTISNIVLPTVAQYVFTFKLNATVNYVGGPNITNIQLSTICNLTNTSDSHYNSETNCTILNPPNYSKFPPFSLSGIPA